MGIHKLKDLQCKNAVCTTGTVRKLADGGGLFLFITPDGSKRWRYRYTAMGIRGGKGPDAGQPGLVEKLLSVGIYPQVSLTAARDEAEKLRKLADPGAIRKATKQAVTVATSNTFEAVARAWLAKQSQWTEKYAYDVQTRLEKYVFYAIGTKAISQISRGELANLMEAIEYKGSAALAHRLMPVMSSIYRYATAKGLCEHNPCGDFKLKDLSIYKPEPVKQPAVAKEQLPALLRAIDTVKNRQLMLAAKLIFLLFVRSNEMLKGEWSEIDLDKAQWRIPAERMKKRLPLLVPLSTQAVDILKELQSLNCGSQYVFPGQNYKKPLSSKALLEVFLNLGYGGKQSVHGIRRIASTALNEASDDEGHLLFHADVIELSLSHVKDALRATYDESEYLIQRRKMYQWWADNLEEKIKEGVEA